jgi:hypothetical protein
MRGGSSFSEQVPVEAIVVLGKERLLPAIAALRDVVRCAGEYGSCEAGHDNS